MDDEKPNDALFVALTRPALKGGIPVIFLLIGLIVTVYVFLITSSFLLSVAVLTTVYLIGRVMGESDPFFSSIIMIKIIRCSQIRNYRFWRGNSYIQ